MSLDGMDRPTGQQDFATRCLRAMHRAGRSDAALVHQMRSMSMSHLNLIGSIAHPDPLVRRIRGKIREEDARGGPPRDTLEREYGLSASDASRFERAVRNTWPWPTAEDERIATAREVMDRYGLPADVPRGRGYGETALGEAVDCARGAELGMLRFLVEERGADVGHVNHFGDTPLGGAVREAKWAAMYYLAGTVPPERLRELLHMRTNTGFSVLRLCALHLYCTYERSDEIVSHFSTLLEWGADVNAVSVSGGTVVQDILDPDERNGSWRARELALEALLCGERAAEVDLTVRVRRAGDRDTGVWAGTLAEEAANCDNPELRGLVLRAAAARERATPGSGDPDNVLGLRPSPRRRAPGRVVFVPQSDPPVDECAGCGAAQAVFRCAGCAFERYCGEACQRERWRQGGHKQRCATLRHRLPPTVQLLRHARGTDVGSPASLVTPGVHCAYSCRRSCPEEAEEGGGAGCACVAAGRPCLRLCPASCALRNPHNRPPDTTAAEGLRLSECAMAHLAAVRALRAEQLGQRYRLPCAGRPFDARSALGDGSGGEHGLEADGAAEHTPSASLRALLGRVECCGVCTGAGVQHAWCFCMNRVVRSDAVKHCVYCGTCFFVRSGWLRCPHCRHRDPKPGGSWVWSEGDPNSPPHKRWAHEHVPPPERDTVTVQWC